MRTRLAGMWTRLAGMWTRLAGMWTRLVGIIYDELIKRGQKAKVHDNFVS